MPLESAPFINGLVSTNPPNADPVQQGADHLRLIKAAIRSSFPNITGAMTATQAVLNGIDGRATALEANRARKDIADTFAARMTFTVGADAASFRRGAAELEPIGTGHIWFTATAPTGYLLLNGQAVSRTTFATLFALWGTTFGAGDGSTTFNVPDLRLRFPVMAGTGLALNSTGGSQTPAVVVGNAGGHNHGGVVALGGGHNHGGTVGGTALTVAQMPVHNHGVADPGHQHDMNTNVAAFSGTYIIHQLTGPGGAIFYSAIGQLSATATTGITIQNSGSGATHNHTITAEGNHQHNITAEPDHNHTATIADGRPPFFAVNFIVRAL